MLFFLDAELKEFANVVDCANCVCTFLTDGEELFTWRDRKRCDALTALDSRNEPLHFLGHIVDYNIMAARVAHYIVVQVDDIVLDIALEAEEKARLHVHAV